MNMSNSNFEDKYFDDYIPCLMKGNSDFNFANYKNKLNLEENNNMNNINKEEFIEPRLTHLVSLEDINNYDPLSNKLWNLEKKINDKNKILNNPSEINKLETLTTEKIMNKKIRKNDNFKLESIENLLNLQSILLKIFYDKDLQQVDVDKLSDLEHKILELILKRKFQKTNINQKSLENFPILETIKLNFKNSHKRAEENYKFVIKRGLKNLLSKFKKSIKKQFKSKNIEEKEFYLHYFREIIQKYDMKIDSFYFPKNTRKSFNIPKSINEKYFENISKSNIFIKEIKFEIEKNIKEKYNKIINSKLKHLLSKFRDFLNKQKDFNLVENYWLKNQKCKFPWSIFEIDNAIKLTWIKINHYSL